MRLFMEGPLCRAIRIGAHERGRAWNPKAMNAVLVLLIAIAACFALRNPLKKAPLAFYVLAAIVVVAFLMLDSLDASRSVRLAFFWTIQKCLVPLVISSLWSCISACFRAHRRSLSGCAPSVPNSPSSPGSSRSGTWSYT